MQNHDNIMQYSTRTKNNDYGLGSLLVRNWRLDNKKLTTWLEGM